MESEEGRAGSRKKMASGKFFNSPLATSNAPLLTIHIPVRLRDLSRAVDRMLLVVLDVLDRLRHADAGFVFHVHQDVVHRIGQVLLGQVANRV